MNSENATKHTKDSEGLTSALYNMYIFSYVNNNYLIINFSIFYHIITWYIMETRQQRKQTALTNGDLTDTAVEGP